MSRTKLKEFPEHSVNLQKLGQIGQLNARCQSLTALTGGVREIELVLKESENFPQVLLKGAVGFRVKTYRECRAWPGTCTPAKSKYRKTRTEICRVAGGKTLHSGVFVTAWRSRRSDQEDSKESITN